MYVKSALDGGPQCVTVTCPKHGGKAKCQNVLS